MCRRLPFVAVVLMCTAACGQAAASPLLDAALSDAGLQRQRFADTPAAADDFDAATVMALTSIAPGAGDPRQPPGGLGTRARDAAEEGDAQSMRRALRGLVQAEARSGFVDDPACGFAQDVESEAASQDCGTPLRFALSTIPGLGLLTRAVSAPPPEMRFSIAPDSIVSAIPVPGTAWLLATLSVVLVLRPPAFRARTPR